MSKNIFVSIIIMLALRTLVGAWYLVSEFYIAQAQEAPRVTFSVGQGESVDGLADRLETEGVVRSAFLFRRYLIAKGIDTNIKSGEYTVEAPITLARVARSLETPVSNERTITILPGWDIREIGKYLEKEGIGTYDEVLQLAGQPAVLYSGVDDTLGVLKDYKVLSSRPRGISYEGYLRPDTYRIFSDATAHDVLVRLVQERDTQFTDKIYADIEKSGRTIHETLTIASILEREVQTPEDRRLVADIFWRRYDQNWALQADSTIHYATGDGIDGNADVFTSEEEREADSLWNTYKYPGLPPGPISNPALDSILAAIHPTKNSYNYFLTTLDTGEVKYATTLDEHNANKAKYLR